MCFKHLAVKWYMYFFFFFQSNSTVPKITADDLAQLNHVAVFSFNLMSVRMQVADNDLFSHSRLVCLKRDCII